MHNWDNYARQPDMEKTQELAGWRRAMCQIFGLMAPSSGHRPLAGAFAKSRLSRESGRGINRLTMPGTRETE